MKQYWLFLAQASPGFVVLFRKPCSYGGNNEEDISVGRGSFGIRADEVGGKLDCRDLFNVSLMSERGTKSQRRSRGDGNLHTSIAASSSHMTSCTLF
jgi:hypothetical protein